jgi:hypothetical protein
VTEPVKSSSGGPSPQRRDVYQAEALVGIALCVGVAVLALPFEWSTAIRWLIAVLSTVFVLFVLGRFPRLSQLIVRVILRLGPVLLVLLAVAIGIVYFGPPTVNLPPAVIDGLIAAALGALGAIVLQTMLLISELRERRKLSGRKTLPSAFVFWVRLLYLLIHGILGALGAFYVRSMPDGQAFTDHPPGAIFAGVAFSSLLDLVSAQIGRARSGGRTPSGSAQPKLALAPDDHETAR